MQMGLNDLTDEITVKCFMSAYTAINRKFSLPVFLYFPIIDSWFQRKEFNSGSGISRFFFLENFL